MPTIFFSIKHIEKHQTFRNAIKELRRRHPKKPLVEVYLHGDCVHDDSAAIRQIAHQLHRNSCIEGFSGENSSAPRNFAESMAELRVALRRSTASEHAQSNGRPIVLILDEFDRFATHSRQMLLYNLYNLIHDAASRVAIVGITSCHDAMDHLEKRVKSRFSQRTIFFPPYNSSEDFIQVGLEL